MVTARVLPVEEWDRVADREPFAVGGLPNPQFWRIVVVERDGQIVACCSLFDTVHWDCFSVNEADRGNPVVFKELIEGGVQVMQEYGIPMVHTTVPKDRPEVARMLLRFGFEQVPYDLFYYRRKV